MNILQLFVQQIKRVKLKTVTVSIIVSTLILLIYQITLIYKMNEPAGLNKSTNSKTDTSPATTSARNKSLVLRTEKIRGTLVNDKKYTPNNNGMLECVLDSIEIDLSRINDDYCDCPTDGFDEPGTNACANGRFYCEYQPDLKHHPKFLTSSQVNDGVCDCCDGSDEWNGIVLTNRLTDAIQRKLGRCNPEEIRKVSESLLQLLLKYS